MYTRNLTKDLRLRLSERDFTFLATLADDRGISISELLRSIIGEYRRALDAMSTLQAALNLANEQKQKEMSLNGDTKTDIDNIV